MSEVDSQIIPVTVDPDGDEKQIECVPAELARGLKRELAEACKQRDTLAKALSMYGLPYSDDEIEHIAQNPSPYTEIGAHEANRELIRRKALAAVKGGGE